MKANDGQANLILLDSAPQPEWNFAALMEAETGEKWNIWHIDSHFSDSAWKKKAKFFLFPLKVLRHRKEFGTILSYQQFYGLFFAFYSAIFHLKKHCHLIVTTFIYRPKQGWKGKLYAWFMRKAVNSPALDKIVCFSSSERRGRGSRLHGGVPDKNPRVLHQSAREKVRVGAYRRADVHQAGSPVPLHAASKGVL